jgi:hypothetical protein
MIIARIGRFFLLIGFLVIFIFMATSQAGNPQYSYFCWGTSGIMLGIYFMWHGHKKTKPSGRFRLFRKKDKNKKNNKESQEAPDNDTDERVQYG